MCTTKILTSEISLFCLFWYLYLYDLNDIDRSYEELLVKYVEQSVDDVFTECNNYKDLKCIKAASSLNAGEEDFKIKGLLDLIALFKTHPCENEFCAMLKNNGIVNDKTMERCRDSIKQQSSANFGDFYLLIKYSRKPNLLYDLEFSARMALACYYRKKDEIKKGIDLLDETKKRGFNKELFFEHMSIRFKIYQIDGEAKLAETIRLSQELINKQKNHIENVVIERDIEWNIINLNIFINVGVYTHEPLCLIRGFEIGVLSRENDSERVKLAIDGIKIAIETSPNFSSAIGYCGVLYYYNAQYDESIKYLQKSMRLESCKNYHYSKYYNNWKNHLHLSEIELSKKSFINQMNDKVSELKKERQEYIQLMALFLSVIAIIVSLIMTLDKPNSITPPKSNILLISPSTDKAFIIFMAFGLVLSTYLMLALFFKKDNETKTHDKNSTSYTSKVIFSMTFLVLFLFITGFFVFLYGHFIDHLNLWDLHITSTSFFRHFFRFLFSGKI